MNYDDPITCLKGIGEKTAALYEKLGIVTIGELMRYYPRSYERFEPPVTIRAAAVMDFAAVRVVICSYPTIKRVHNLSIINTKVRDEEGSELRVTWFQTTIWRACFVQAAGMCFAESFQETENHEHLISRRFTHWMHMSSFKNHCSLLCTDSKNHIKKHFKGSCSSI